jgi:alkylation response protein AidB-like acyl-CoA dehydrogenase
MDPHHAVLEDARRIANESLAPAASENDRLGRFPEEGVGDLGRAGILGLTVPGDLGGLGLGPRTFAGTVAVLAEADASAAMVFVMHASAVACIAGAPRGPETERALREIAAGRHLTTLAFSERGSRSHFWAPVSRAEPNGHGVYLSAKKSWVTSASHADSYVATTLALEAKSPVETTLYLVDAKAPGVRVEGRFDGLGLRGNDSSPVTFDRCLVPDDRRLTKVGEGMAAKLAFVLPLFNLGVTAMSLGICRAAVRATSEHLKGSKLEHLGSTLGEAYPNLRARLATMQIETDGLAARMEDLVSHLERPDDLTMLRVLESKAAANETAIRVTSEAMRACGGAAFSKQTSIDRNFRDAQAGAVMAPTVDHLQEFIGRALLGMPLM